MKVQTACFVVLALVSGALALQGKTDRRLDIDARDDLVEYDPDGTSLQLVANDEGDFSPALVESEVGVGEFPTQEYCNLSPKNAWELAEKIKNGDKSAKVPCPVFTEEGGKVVFHACCAYRTLPVGTRDYYCHIIDATSDATQHAELLKQLDAYKEALKSGRPHSALRFIHPKCPAATDRKKMGLSILSERAMSKVCESKNDCLKSGPNGEDHVCCWNPLSTAPGLCSDSCGRLEREVAGRCDDTEDCKDISDAHGLICCQDTGVTTSADRRGFCKSECGATATFSCGLDNTCSSDNKGRKSLKRFGDDTKKTCCQSLEATMSNKPVRSCMETCPMLNANITSKKTPDLISVMPYQPLKTITIKGSPSVPDRAYNLQRFAQVASRIMERQDEVSSFLEISDKVTVSESCSVLKEAAQPLLLHVANSLLSAVTPFLAMNMFKSDTVAANLANIGTLKGPVTAQSLLADKAEGALAELFGIAATSSAAADIKPIKDFLKGFKWAPEEKNPDGSWFHTQVDLFNDATDWVLQQCKQSIVDAGFYIEKNGTSLKFPHYGTFAHATHRKKGFKESLVKANISDQTEEGLAEIKRRRVAYNKARVCFSLWNRVYFGMQYLGDELAKESEVTSAILSTLSSSVSAIGSALGPLTFGATNIAGKIASHFIAKKAAGTKEEGQAAQKSLAKLSEITMASVSKSFTKNRCRRIAVNKGTTIMKDSEGQYDPTLVCKSEYYPGSIQGLVKEHLCFGEYSHLLQMHQAAKGQDKVVGETATAVLGLEKRVLELQIEVDTTTKAAGDLANEIKTTEAEAKKAKMKNIDSTLKPLKDKLKQLTEQKKVAEENLKKTKKQLEKETKEAGKAKSKSQQTEQAVGTEMKTLSPEKLAKVEKGLALVMDQDYLKGVVHDYFLPCLWKVALPSRYLAIKQVFKQIASAIACDPSANEADGAKFFKENVAGLSEEEQRLYETYNKMLPNYDFALKVISVVNKAMAIGIAKGGDLLTNFVDSRAGFDVAEWEKGKVSEGFEKAGDGLKDLTKGIPILGDHMGDLVDKAKDKEDGWAYGDEEIPFLGGSEEF